MQSAPESLLTGGKNGEGLQHLGSALMSSPKHLAGHCGKHDDGFEAVGLFLRFWVSSTV